MIGRSRILSRVGVNALSRSITAAARRELPFGWFKDYTQFGRAFAVDDQAVEYVPILLYQGKFDTPGTFDSIVERYARLCPNFTEDEFADCLSIERLKRRLSGDTEFLGDGTLFLLGVEPGYADNNDDRTPGQIVEDAVLLKSVLTRVNPSYRLGLGGISTPSCEWTVRAYGGRNGFAFWEEILRKSDRDLFDSFVIHPYPTDPLRPVLGDLVSQVRGARRLLLEHDLSDRDLLVGETGVPFAGVSGEAVRTYTAQAVEFYLTAADADIGHPLDQGRLVQKFCWFLLHEPEWEIPGFTDNPALDFGASALVDRNGQLTKLGSVFRAAVQRVAGRGRV